MPPVSHTSFAASILRQQPLGTSPDNDSGNTEAELQPKLSKKKKKKQAQNAAKQIWDEDEPDKPNEINETRIELDPDPPQAPVAASSLLSQIPNPFPRPQKPTTIFHSDDQYREQVGEKVSDQSTPPVDDFFKAIPHGWSPPQELPIAVGSLAGSPPAQPGFSTRAAFSTRSPPISPPQRYARPISYGGSIPPVPSQPRVSSSPYSRTTSQYGSPPAPHLPQQHFYNAQDVDIQLPTNPHVGEAQEPVLIKHTLVPIHREELRPGIIVGYTGRISLLLLNNGRLEEIGALTGLPGTAVDASLLPISVFGGRTEVADRIIAVILHSARSSDNQNEQVENGNNIPGYSAAATVTTQYVTSVELYSLSSQQHITTLLELPPVFVQSYRGTLPDPSPPAGNLRLLTSGKYVVVASGTSGEVFIFGTGTNSTHQLECLGKVWTTVQRQIRRRDSSHDRSSDTDMSPADLSRGLPPQERAVTDLNGRWLAIAPAESPSRPSLSARLGPEIICRRHAGFETITAPAKPSLTCEVDSPDADTMLGKVARGVAQELVKGAKWLGDQGYQTWQNYWKKEQSPPTMIQQQQPYSPPTFAAQRPSGAFPPTHAESIAASKEPEIVSIYDLDILDQTPPKSKQAELRPMATFQPPRGCSFLSFSPNGLTLLTAGRKGDVQYIWDLMQVRHRHAYIASDEQDRSKLQPRVRQIARYERLSGSTIVDVTWEKPDGNRFAVLTKNRTVHLFDLPQNALRWPPPRTTRRARKPAKPIDNTLGAQDASQAGFFASAMTIASKAQPIVAGWRGRAPSMSGGLAGIGQTSMGIAAATGARSSKAVAAGLSKSLGAASETVSHIRHAGESRLHIKSYYEPVAGRITWIPRGQNVEVCVLDQESVKLYRVRKTRHQDRANTESTSVFDTRKASIIRLLQFHELRPISEGSEMHNPPEATTQDQLYSGFCKLDKDTENSSTRTPQHPLSYAEIETNAPYQPFHSDRRVSLYVFANHSFDLDASSTPRTSRAAPSATHSSEWVFGDEIPLYQVNLTRVQAADDDSGQDSVIYRETTMTASTTQDGVEHIVSTTRRARKKRVNPDSQDEGETARDDFFEDDCEVLDFATDRV